MLSIAQYASILNSIVAGRACLETARPADPSEIAPQKSLLPVDLANKHRCHGNWCCWEPRGNSECRPLPMNSNPVVDVGPALPQQVDAVSRVCEMSKKSRWATTDQRSSAYKALGHVHKRPKKNHISHYGQHGQVNSQQSTVAHEL